MKNTKRICIYIAITVLYVGLSLALGSLSFGLVQIRLAECLQVACLKDVKYTMPITIGCFLTNVIGTAFGMTILPLDAIVGTIATCMSCLLVHLFADVTSKNGRPYLSLLMPVIINGILIGLLYAYVMCPSFSLKKMLTYFAYTSVSIAISELISCFLIGLIIYKPVLKVLEHYDPSEVGYN